jgi:hypothetical protein
MSDTLPPSTRLPVPSDIAVCPECHGALVWITRWREYWPFEQTPEHHSVLGMGVTRQSIGCLNPSYPHGGHSSAWLDVFAQVKQWVFECEKRSLGDPHA